MNNVGRFVLGLTGLLAGGGITLWFVWRSVKKADDPGRVLFKWIVTAVVFGILVWLAVGLHHGGSGAAFAVPIAGAAFGVFLGILWAPHLGALLAKPLTSFYDGGDAEIEARPFYAIARAKQKRGNYTDAITEVRKQLLRFPEDYEGWMFLAEIYANDLKDHAAAQQCIEEILSHENHAPKNIAFALNRSADWYLSFASDRESARNSLEWIMARFPDSDLAHAAAQRIAHLTTDKMLAEQKERPRIALVHHDEYIGLRGQVADPRPPAEEPAAAAARLVEHLGNYPEDAEAREDLARIYADHYARIDLASDQIEQLITTPGSTQKDIARWLNMLADFHVRVDQNKEGAAAALHRVVELFPKAAVAAQAETRIAYLGTEMMKNKKSQALKLGSYERNSGLGSEQPDRESRQP